MRAGGEIAYVAVGANLGDREETFARVIAELEGLSDVLVLSASSVFETAPLGTPGQSAYLNGVLALRSWLGPLDLLHGLQAIEAALGRDRSRESVRWGPRTIDLDLLFFGDRCLEVPELTVPHPRAHERAFVLTPLAEVAPEYRHPILGIEIAEMARAQADHESVRPWPRPTGWPGADC